MLQPSYFNDIAYDMLKLFKHYCRLKEKRSICPL